MCHAIMPFFFNPALLESLVCPVIALTSHIFKRHFKMVDGPERPPGRVLVWLLHRCCCVSSRSRCYDAAVVYVMVTTVT